MVSTQSQHRSQSQLLALELEQPVAAPALFSRKILIGATAKSVHAFFF
jgi:hypothetical protein